MLLGSLFPSINYGSTANPLKAIIESKDTRPEVLESAREVLLKRLEAYGVQDVEVKTMPDKGQLAFSIGGGYAAKEIMPLLLTAGRLEFCEVYTQAEAVQALKGSEDWKNWARWFPESADNARAVVATIAAADLPEFQRFAQARAGNGSLPAGLEFAPGRLPAEDGSIELYALRYNNGHRPLAGSEAVKSSNAEYTEASASAFVGITFNKEGAERWAQATRDNIGRPLAIAMDGIVFMAPKVMAEINFGKAQISGDFSLQEAKLLAALIQGGELPAAFHLVSVSE